MAVIGAGSIVTEVVGDTCLQRALDPAVFARAYASCCCWLVAEIAVGALLAPLCVAAIGLSATFALLGFVVAGYGLVILARVRDRRVVTRVRRVAIAAAMTIGLATAGASAASADAPSPVIATAGWSAVGE